MTADRATNTEHAAGRVPWEQGDRPALTGPWWVRGLRAVERDAAAFGSGWTLTPSWARDVERLVVTVPGQRCATAGGWRDAPALVVAPFAEHAVRRFDAVVHEHDHHAIADLDAVRASLHEGLTRRLVALVVRVLDPHARQAQQARQVHSLADLLDEYPVLARAMVTAANQAAAAHAEFLARLAEDRDLMRTHLFRGTEPGIATDVRLDLGDPRDGGRTVGTVRFASGAKAVYRPRPVAVHRHVNDIVAWYNTRLPAEVRLRTLAVLDRGGHGWVDHVEHVPGTDPQRYHRRLGALLALLRAVAAVDLGAENVVAVEDQPVLVGVESVFQVNLPGDDDPGVTAYRESVGHTGLLPALDRPDALLDGYRTGYRVLAEARDELTRPGGLLDRCAEDEVRVLARPLREYTELLNATTHPDACRDGLDRDRVLGALGTADPVRARLVEHELADLWAGNVPMFTACVGERDVCAADGGRIDGLLPESGLARVTRGLAAMGEADLARQEWIIAAHAGGHPATTDPVDEDRHDRHDRHDRMLPVPLRALTQALAIGDTLERSAIVDGDRVGWLGLDLVGGRWTVGPVGADLRGGHAGIALFFAQLAKVGGSGRHAEFARRVLAPLADDARSRVGDDPARVLGAFTGLAGVAYAMAVCAEALDDDTFVARADELLHRIAGHVPGARTFDVARGVAGCLAVAEALIPVCGSAAALADRCAAALLDAAVPAGAGTRWPVAEVRPSLESGHDAAGIGWALLTHAARTGHDQAAETGRRALAHAHDKYNEYDAVSGTWPGAPGTAAGDPPLVAWCQGAAGIGVAKAIAATDLPRSLRPTRSVGKHRHDSLGHGDLGKLELFAAEGITDPNTAAWRPLIAEPIIARIERLGPVCGTPGAVPTPGLLHGLAGIGHGLLRIADPDATPPAILLQPPLR